MMNQDGTNDKSIFTLRDYTTLYRIAGTLEGIQDNEPEKYKGRFDLKIARLKEIADKVEKEITK